MEWNKNEEHYRVPIKSWCREIEDGALSQAEDLATHPCVASHVALMPDCHQGYGMPIGGVIACRDAVIPNAVGVDIGCGMGAVKTDIRVESTSMKSLREITKIIKEKIPVGEGKSHKKAQPMEEFEFRLEDFKGAGWYSSKTAKLAEKNLGTLGGGNHFIEIQKDGKGIIWLMIHSGSRNLGYVIAKHYNKIAQEMAEREGWELPTRDLAYLPAGSREGKEYIRDMDLALAYAMENRRRIMNRFMEAFREIHRDAVFGSAVNIHHNYAALETHFGEEAWVHRKGATSAKKGETGIIPGSMGTPSYIVEGKGNEASFMSCSHGAGRVMGRMEASRRLTMEECNASMEGIVCDRWQKQKRGKVKYDFGEAPRAYKNIEDVISSQRDLINPVVRLTPIAVVKG